MVLKTEYSRSHRYRTQIIVNSACTISRFRLIFSTQCPPCPRKCTTPPQIDTAYTKFRRYINKHHDILNRRAFCEDILNHMDEDEDFIITFTLETKHFDNNGDATISLKRNIAHNNDHGKFMIFIYEMLCEFGSVSIINEIGDGNLFKKTERQQWSAGSMEEAVDSVISGKMGYKKHQNSLTCHNNFGTLCEKEKGKSNGDN
ncbi:hypothetical protein ANN_02902 [Periplaneta americana]|uniref:Uncharacterized protein n=1 Tax=Periplaneta americana TaxID=6978 RepID=A0ABQ8U275_PERAM|nr:hypothetical protein ANN_02902 [Periplaneta americana]